MLEVIRKSGLHLHLPNERSKEWGTNPLEAVSGRASCVQISQNLPSQKCGATCCANPSNGAAESIFTYCCYRSQINAKNTDIDSGDNEKLFVKMGIKPGTWQLQVDKTKALKVWASKF